MASAQKLIDKILADAKLDAEKVAQETERKKRELSEKTNRIIQKQVAEIERAAEQTVIEDKKRIEAIFDLEHRKQLLSAKQQVMEQAKSLALEKLSSLNKEDYLLMLKKRLLACAANGEGEIIISNSEKAIDAAFVNGVNGELKKTTGKGNVKLLQQKREMRGGFVYIDGGLEIDVSLESMLEQIWQQHEPQIAAILFEENLAGE